MKKFFRLFVLTAAGIFLTGCSHNINRVSNNQDSGDESYEETPEIQPVTIAESLPEVDTLKPAQGTYVYDNAGVFTAEETAALNSYAEYLYENYLINAAVVTAKSMGDKTPYDYAAEAYNDVYEGRGSGLLLLVNNDTFEDYLFKTGSCNAFISEEVERLAFFWSTKDMVSGDYRSAVLRIMQLGEICPQHVFDNVNVLGNENVSAIEKKLKSSEKNISLLVTSNSTEKTNEEICREYYSRRYKEEKGYMLMLDTATNKFVMVSDEALPAEFENARAEAEKLAAEGDIIGAVQKMTDALTG